MGGSRKAECARECSMCQRMQRVPENAECVQLQDVRGMYNAYCVPNTYCVLNTYYVPHTYCVPTQIPSRYCVPNTYWTLDAYCVLITHYVILSVAFRSVISPRARI